MSVLRRQASSLVRGQTHTFTHTTHTSHTDLGRGERWESDKEREEDEEHSRGAGASKSDHLCWLGLAWISFGCLSDKG